jgi:hypothetical protein
MRLPQTCESTLLRSAWRGSVRWKNAPIWTCSTQIESTPACRERFSPSTSCMHPSSERVRSASLICLQTPYPWRTLRSCSGLHGIRNRSSGCRSRFGLFRGLHRETISGTGGAPAVGGAFQGWAITWLDREPRFRISTGRRQSRASKKEAPTYASRCQSVPSLALLIQALSRAFPHFRR